MIDKCTPNKLCRLTLELEKQQRTLEAKEIDITQKNINVSSSYLDKGDDDVVIEISPLRIVRGV